MADSGTERSSPAEDMPRLGPTWSRGGGMFKPPKRPQGDPATDGVREGIMVFPMPWRYGGRGSVMSRYPRQNDTTSPVFHVICEYGI